jgi:hypothetical protein
VYVFVCEGWRGWERRIITCMYIYVLCDGECVPSPCVCVSVCVCVWQG